MAIGDLFAEDIPVAKQFYDCVPTVVDGGRRDLAARPVLALAVCNDRGGFVAVAD
jgi:hypothetical protein